MTETVYSLDVETHAIANLKAVGSKAYLRDPDTDVILFAYHEIGNPNDPSVWVMGDAPPQDLVEHVNTGGALSGWNVLGFDAIAWDEILVKRHGFPPIQRHQWQDSMQLAAAANLPRSLDGCAKAVGVPYVGDLKDNNILRRITNKKLTPVIQGADLEWLRNRCVQDVVMEEETLKRLPPWFTMPPWNRMRDIDRRINDRGVLMDVELVKGLRKIAEEETARLDAAMKALTNGAVRSTSVIEQLKTWLMSRGVELPLKGSSPADEEEGDDEDEDDGKKAVYRLRKSDIADILARPDIPDDCRQALEWRAEAAKASVKKLKKMLVCADDDGRLRGALVLGGAAQTLRFASKDWQGHNFVRDTIGTADDIEAVHGISKKKDPVKFKRLAEQTLQNAIETGRKGDRDLAEMLWTATRKDAQGRVRVEGVLPWVGRMLRRTLTAQEGNLLLNGDFAQIEARIPVHLAAQTDKVEAFRNGVDMYRLQASPIFGKPPEDLSSTERQSGKVTILACFAEGSLVLTDKGYVPIEQVGIDSKVWDGVCWVSQEGPVFQGYRDTITYDGIEATAEHMVYIEGESGKVPFGFAAVRQIPLLRSRTSGQNLWSCENNVARKNMDARRETVRGYAVHDVRFCTVGVYVPPYKRQEFGVPNVYPSTPYSTLFDTSVGSRETSLLEPERRQLRGLWGTRYSIQFSFCDGRWVMGIGEPRTASTQRRIGSCEQQRKLRRGEPTLDRQAYTDTEHSPCTLREIPGYYDTFGSCVSFGESAATGEVVCGHNFATFSSGNRFSGNSSIQNRQSTLCVQTARPVWDILNAGPQHRFTVSDRLVSNCGFAGGVNAFVPMAMNYGLCISREEAAPIVKGYRDDNPQLVKYWDVNLEAARNAVAYPGKPFTVGPTNLLTWYLDGNCLKCYLPSGRPLRYWGPRLETGYWPDGGVKNTPDLTVLAIKGRAVFRRTLWRGLSMEGPTQAIAADMLATAICNCEDAGLPVIWHTHDSINAEVPKSQAEKLLPTFEKAMLSQPSWTAGLPIAVSCDISARFG